MGYTVKINGVDYDLNENQTHVWYKGEYREVWTDQEGDMYILSNDNPIYLDKPDQTTNY